MMKEKKEEVKNKKQGETKKRKKRFGFSGLRRMKIVIGIKLNSSKFLRN